MSRVAVAAAVGPAAFSAVGLASAGRASSAQTPAGYCRATGGVVKVRVPTYGTNNAPSQWLRLGGGTPFCEWTAKDESRIDVHVFPGGSAMDAFGLFYRTARFVRGKNLTTILRYHPANPPNVFGP